MKRALCSAAAAAAGLLITLYAPSARAGDLFQFDDSSENVRLLLNGNPVTASGGTIFNFNAFTVPEPGGGAGEMIQFDYVPTGNILLLWDGTTNNLPYIYTQLYEPGAVGQIIVSDEFGIRPILDGVGQPTGAFNVAFTSADQALIPPQFPGINLTPSPLSALEINGYQNVGFIVEHNAANTLVATFQVNSVPEPETYAMLLAGLGALGLILRGRRQA